LRAITSSKMRETDLRAPLERQGLRLGEVLVVEPTLEDVFLALASD
jgi:hypothetical protein